MTDNMSDFVQPSPERTQDFSGKKVAIVASVFNQEYTDALVSNCIAELEKVAPELSVKTVRVPGSFEIPMGIKALVESAEDYDCYIALGVILKGSTAHDMHVGSAVGHALMDLAIAHNTPVINEVLHVLDLDQARERCMGEKLNRGVEAARTAYEMIKVFAELK